MGNRSWFTEIDSINEVKDLLFAINRMWKRLGPRCNVDFLIMVKESKVFRSKAVVAWSSDGDWAIKGLPYYLRQQTKLLDQVMRKFPEYRDPAEHGEVFVAPEECVVTYLELALNENPNFDFSSEEDLKGMHEILELKGVEESHGQLLFLMELLKNGSLSGLPAVHIIDGEPRTEETFIEKLYRRFYRDPSMLAQNKTTMFLCHSSEDKAIVREFARKLEEFGISVWLDESEIRFGESLIWKIASDIEKIDFVLAFVSKASSESNWVKKELSMAMSIEISEGSFRVVPLLIDNCTPPLFLRDKLYFEPANDVDLDVKILLQSLIPSCLVPEVVRETSIELGIEQPLTNHTLTPTDLGKMKGNKVDPNEQQAAGEAIEKNLNALMAGKYYSRK